MVSGRQEALPRQGEDELHPDHGGREGEQGAQAGRHAQYSLRRRAARAPNSPPGRTKRMTSSTAKAITSL